MTTLTLSPELEAAIASVAERAGRPPQQIVNEGLAQVLEDWEDLLDALEVERTEDPSERISHEELMVRYGLAD